MQYYKIPPPAQLSGFVKCFWVGEMAPVPGKELRHLSIATGAARIVFHYEGRFGSETAGGGWEPSFLAGFQGQSAAHRQFVSAERSGIFGVELLPGSIPALFGMPATELTGAFAELGSVLGKTGDQWQRRMLSAAGNGERAQLAGEFLSALAPGRHAAIVAAAARELAFGGMDEGIDALAQRFNTSRRQFERTFRNGTGLSPGTYGRILRFERAVGKIPGNRRLTDVALDSGYYDQAHFIRDFRELAGMSPGQYRKAIAGLPFPEE